MPNPIKTQCDLPIQMRSAMLAPIDAADSTSQQYRVTWTTGATVRRYDWVNDQPYDEELQVDANSVRLGRLNSGTAPVLDSHSAYSIDDVKGIVVADSARLESGGIGVADILLDDGPENEAVVRKVQSGMIRNVSVGYRVYQYEVIQREGQVPVYRATDWEPFEISLVPIGADAGAGIRSAPITYPCEFIQPNPKETRTMPETENPQTPATPQTPAPETPANENPAPATPAAPAAPETEAARAEGARQERSRVTEIGKIVTAVRLPETFAQRCINEGHGIDKVRKMAIDELARISAEGGEIRPQVSIVRDEIDTVRAMAENALLHRHDPGKYKLDDGAREYRGMTLMEIGRDILKRRGIETRGMSKSELAGVMLGLETRGGLHSTSDFANIVLNISTKTLRNAYEAAPQTFKPFCRQVTAPDFKTIARVQLGDAPTLDKVNESGEFKRGTVSDAKEQYALATYGKVVAINRQTIINDDLGAFTRLPEMFGRAAADLQSDTVWGIITANAAMGDGTALFHATHGNLDGTNAAISVTSLGNGRAGMRKQKGINGRFINVQPKYLLVPASLETVAQQYCTQTNIVYTKNSDYNPFANNLQVIPEPRLDANSLLSWYLAAEPSQIDTIEYCFLEGQEGAYLESRLGFDVDGLELKARLDFAAKAIDWKGLWKNTGA